MDPEEQKILLWRADTLERAGYSTPTAAAIAAAPVDVELARRLRQKGCSEELAREILL